MWIRHLALGLCLASGCGQSARAEREARTGPVDTAKAPGATSGLRATVSDLVHSSMEAHGVSALTLAVVQRDGVVWREAFGDASPRQAFPVGSLTKPITALAVLQLVDAGRIGLDQPVAELVPGFAAVSKRITVRHLLAHQAGLPGDWLHGMWSDDPPPWQSVVEELAGERLPHEPGEVSVYSNAGYAVLGVVLETVTGEPYETYVRTHVLEPLGMDATFERPAGITEPRVRLIPAGGLYANVDDMARLIELVLGRGETGSGALLSPERFDEMISPQNGVIALDLDLRRGLGFLLSRAELAHAGTVVWHTGWTPGHHAQLMVLPDHGVGVVVLARSATAGPVVDAVAMQALETELLETEDIDPPDPAAVPLAPPAPRGDLDHFVGRYATDMSTLEITRGDGVLHSRSLAGHATLQPLLDGTFDVVELPGLRVTFERVAGRDLVVYLRRGFRGFLAQKLPAPGLIPASWTGRLGAYELVEEPNPIGTNWALVERDGYLALTYDLVLEDPPTPVTMVLRPETDVHAVVEGLGRSKGDTITADGSTLHWAGYALRRVATSNAGG